MATDRPLARPVPDKETRQGATVPAAVDDDHVSNHAPAADPTSTVAEEAQQVAPPSAVGVAAEGHSPAKSAVNGAPEQQHTTEAEHFGATAPQLRRFIKSRTYVPMHELRRRFGIEGGDDDVTGVDVDREHRVFVGLPTREGRLLGELFRAGDVGYELSLDPISPIVVGVFPMRPLARG